MLNKYWGIVSMKAKKGAEAPHAHDKGNKKMLPFNTKGGAFIATSELRASEFKVLSKWFHDHPDDIICTNDVMPILGKQINHCTRVVKDLLDAGIIEPAYSAVTKYSKIPVRHVRLARPQAQRVTMKVIQHKINFDYGN